MKQRSWQYNAFMNCTRTVSSIIFPLILFRYVNGILMVENMGKVHFSNSIINYFGMIACLGIPSYAVREGVRLRDKPDELRLFCSQMFSLNLLSTAVSYALLFGAVACFPALHPYRVLLTILSVNILGTTIGVGWFFSVIEDYTYVTVRTLLFQILSLALTFLLVKTPDDLYIYAVILVLSTSGASLINFLYSMRFVRIGLTATLNPRRHLAPILILFSTSIAIVIYVNSDVTMLGLMVGDYAVGIYSVAVKIYTILKNVLASILAVLLPRLSLQFARQQMDEYQKTLSSALSALFILTLPVIIGINVLCRETVLIVSGPLYLGAMTPLRILSVSIFFSIFASFFSNSVLLPQRKEKIVLVATTVSAAVNVLLNLFMIPIFHETGAAITTLLAEITVVLIEIPFVKGYVKADVKPIVKSCLGCVWIALYSAFILSFSFNLYWRCAMVILGSTLGYFLIVFDEFLREWMPKSSEITRRFCSPKDENKS